MIIYEKPFTIEYKDNKIIANGKIIEPAVRTYADLKDVLIEPFDKDGGAYYMFRDVFKNGPFRYDITVIPHWEGQEECAKTYGHSHPFAEPELSYPEVYQVIDGEAIFLLQKELKNGTNDVTVVEAKTGDVVLIPPNYSHITINPSVNPLILANVVSDNFTSDYSSFKQNHGGAYYYTKEKIFKQNPSYMIHKNERISGEQLNKRYNFESKDLLADLYTNPSMFVFLNKPSILPKSE